MEDDLENLSVRELKALLDERRVDYRDCVEKRDLVRRARDTAHLAGRGAAASAASAAGLDCVVLDTSPATPPEWVVIVLHGYGANRDDLVPLGKAVIQQLTNSVASSTPSVRFIHPNAHMALSEGGAAPAGAGRMWWPIDLSAMFLSFLSGQITKTVPAGIEEARRMVTDLISKVQKETGLPLSRFVLAGFSQGAMLATDVALHLSEPPAALCIFSGVLLCEEIWKPLMPKRAGMRVLLSHGSQDPLLPQALGVLLKNGFETAGVAVEYIPFEGGHTIPPAALTAFIKLLSGLCSSSSSASTSQS